MTISRNCPPLRFGRIRDLRSEDLAQTGLRGVGLRFRSGLARVVRMAIDLLKLKHNNLTIANHVGVSGASRTERNYAEGRQKETHRQSR
jgi:hypothetical protein